MKREEGEMIGRVRGSRLSAFESRGWRRSVAVALTTTLWSVVMGSVVFASEAQVARSETQVVDTGQFLELPPAYEMNESFQADPDSSAKRNGAKALWAWRKGGLVYALGDFDFHDGATTFQGRSQSYGYRRLAAFDAKSLRQVAERQLPRYAIDASHEAAVWPNHVGYRQLMTVDDDGGRLFVAYARKLQVDIAALGDPTQAGWTVSGLSDDAARRSAPCGPRVSDSGAISRSPCFGGLLMLDAATLEVEATLSLESVSLSSVLYAPIIRALRFVPPVPHGPGPRVLAVVEDIAVATGAESRLNEIRSRQSFHWLVQFDPATQRAEWMFRLDACRGPREGSGRSHPNERALPNPAAVYRSTNAADLAINVGCFVAPRTAGVVRVPLDVNGMPWGAVRLGEAGALVEEPSQASARQFAAPAPGVEVRSGPAGAIEVLADPEGQRLLFRVVDGGAEVWWVFDVRRMDFVGTIGIGPYYYMRSTMNTLDEATGRLYVLGRPLPERGFPGGLFVADTRRTPVPQALMVPQLGTLAADNTDNGSALNNSALTSLLLLRGSDQEPRRLFVPQGSDRWRVLHDHIPLTTDEPADFFAGRSLDLPERDGVTDVDAAAAARGYGTRVLLVGGLEAAGRAGPIDPGAWYGVHGTELPLGNERLPGGGFGYVWRSHACTQSNRELVLAFTGPRDAAVVDGNGSRGAVQPLVVDSSTTADAEQPVSRCAPSSQEVRLSWGDAWRTALFAQPPAAEPGLGMPGGPDRVECLSSEGSPTASSGDPIADMFAARVSCDGEEASGWSQARGVGVEAADLYVAQALSSFRIYRDPGRGIVSRIESVARGIDLGGIKIDTVRGMAESWANGRRFIGEPLDPGSSYQPNCDMQRTAGTCFQRHLFGVRTAAYSCGPCGDEKALVQGLDRALGANGRARLRDPDPLLARGAENGFAAAITKPEHERFSDLVLNNDLLQTVVPTLEIVRQAPPQQLEPVLSSARAVAPTPVRGRQIYQFAGVEVSSSYGITCLLVYDEAANTCDAGPVKTGALKISLADLAGTPLAGGAFEVRSDSDADGVAGLADALVPGGACLTGDDGTGTCRFEQLPAGPYLVIQTAAPAGYAAVSQPFATTVASGGTSTVAFVNRSNLATIQVRAVDEADQPLPGAVFVVFADPDGDGRVAIGAQPAATCTTGSSGVCTMAVPTGSYVLVQTVAPGGLEPIEPVAFALTAGGQTAAVGVVNSPRERATAAPEPVALSYEPATPVATPEVEVSESVPLSEEPRPPATVPEQIDGTIIRIIRAPGDAVRLLSRDPLQALAWTASLAVLSLALLAVRRRAALITVTTASTVAPVGAGARPPSAGAVRHRSPSGGAGSTMMQGVSLRERPASPPSRSPIAGAAPTVGENLTATVVTAIASHAVAELVAQRLAGSGRCRLIGSAQTLEQVRELLAMHSADVLIVDLALSVGEEDLCEALAQLQPPARTIGLIRPGRSRDALAMRGYVAGLAGLLVVPDDVGNGQLCYAARCVAGGKRFYGPSVQTTLLDRLDRGPTPRRTREPSRLTARELEVALLAAEGMRRSEIARKLFVSHETVKLHLRAVRAKLGVVNPWDRSEVRKRLEEAGMLDDGSPRSSDE